MDKFDREVQKQLLQGLYDAHPEDISEEFINSIEEAFGSENGLISNLIYLEEHGLITSGLEYNLDDCEINYGKLRIINDGVDFIRDDGGLGAILRVMNVRLHYETLDELERIINASTSATNERKQKLISQLRSLPSDAIKQLTIRLLGQGLDHLPDAFHIIQKALHHS